MLRMRLTRMGAKKRPSYRVIVTDSGAPRDGRHVDIVGFYDPMTSPTTINIDTDRAVQWLRHGAEPSDRVRILLRHAGVLKAHEAARLEDKRVRKEAAADAPARAERPAPAPRDEAALRAGRLASLPRSASAPVAAVAEATKTAKTTRRGAAKGRAPAVRAAKAARTRK